MDAISLIYSRYPSSPCAPARLAKALRSRLESAPHIHHHFRLLPGRLVVAERKACHRPGAAMTSELSLPLPVEADTGAPKPRSPRSPEHFLGHWHAAVRA